MVLLSLWAALGEVWVTGVLVGWVVDRGGWFWLVVSSVEVAADIRASGRSGKVISVEGPRGVCNALGEYSPPWSPL